MINSRARNHFCLKIIFYPRKGCFLSIKKPYIILCFITSISTKDYQIRFGINHCMSVSLPWCIIFISHLDCSPNRPMIIIEITIFLSQVYISHLLVILVYLMLLLRRQPFVNQKSLLKHELPFQMVLIHFKKIIFSIYL